MKDSARNKSQVFIRGALTAVTLAALCSMTMPPDAEAALQGSAGNTIVRNTITVNYKDTNGNAQTPVSATVDFTVNTVAATPTVLSFTPSPGSTDGTGATQPYNVKIRTNSNGPGAISFATADGTFTNVAAGTPPTVPANLYLGSTIIDPSDLKIGVAQGPIAIGANIVFAVPNDNAAVNDAGGGGAVGDGNINGLKIGDTAWIYAGGATYYGPFTVGTVTDPAAGAGITAAPGSIQLINASLAPISFTPASGWQIVEEKTVAVTATQGAVTNATLAASWVTTVTATMAGAAGGTGTVTTNARMGKLAVTKYVRNVTTPMVGTGSSGALNTINASSYTYYTGGVTGKPGEVLEYLAAMNGTGTGNSTTIVALDSIPYYTTLLTGSAYGTSGGGIIFAHAKLGGTETDLKTDGSLGNASVAYGASTGTVGGSNMSFYLGNGSSGLGGGTLTPGQMVYLIYQVAIN